MGRIAFVPEGPASRRDRVIVARHEYVFSALLNRPGRPGVLRTRSYRTLRDGSFGWRFSRHFVPGYDRTVPPGQFATGFSQMLLRKCLPARPGGTTPNFPHDSRHFVPGYDHAVPLGQNTSRLEGYLDRSQAGDHQVDSFLEIGQGKTVSDNLVHR
jgi:hypothetical protein